MYLQHWHSCRSPCGCRVSFDGKNTIMLHPNDSVRLTVAQWPLPMITAETLDRDWFDGITEKLGWNNNIKNIQRTSQQTLPFPAACRMYDTQLDKPQIIVHVCVLWVSVVRDMVRVVDLSRTSRSTMQHVYPHGVLASGMYTVSCARLDNCTLCSDGARGAPSCVHWPSPENLMAGHHMGQDVQVGLFFHHLASWLLTLASCACRASNGCPPRLCSSASWCQIAELWHSPFHCPSF